ncbi:hypothetical protein B0J18DRAFT_261582 [Chaetomium sp. MPI-SDFR-AT-0129]|nr:hypothetical protein B0J18DRAFT_261582 [Chaetomium sp. MPI-SDFR-AT-0129]
MLLREDVARPLLEKGNVLQKKKGRPRKAGNRTVWAHQPVPVAVSGKRDEPPMQRRLDGYSRAPNQESTSPTSRTNDTTPMGQPRSSHAHVLGKKFWDVRLWSLGCAVTLGDHVVVQPGRMDDVPACSEYIPCRCLRGLVPMRVRDIRATSTLQRRRPMRMAEVRGWWRTTGCPAWGRAAKLANLWKWVPFCEKFLQVACLVLSLVNSRSRGKHQ